MKIKIYNKFPTVPTLNYIPFSPMFLSFHIKKRNKKIILDNSMSARSVAYLLQLLKLQRISF
nr:MAG TPA: hypothetical protein [Inoviridae sp.]